VTAVAIPRRRGITIGITSGKGGVGKTSVAINVAAALAGLGYRVGILDADFALGNVDVMLGLTPGRHVGAVLAGDCTPNAVFVEAANGIHVIPAGSGIRALTVLTAEQWSRLGALMASAAADLDFLIVDTAAGIWDNVLDLARLIDHMVVVTSQDPTAIVDAYAMVKLLMATSPEREIGVVVNQARDINDAQTVFRRLDLAAQKFLNRNLRYDGYVVRDAHVQESAMNQHPVVTHVPDAPASRCFRMLALRLASWLPSHPITFREFECMEAPQCA
jgi:flagellar biosynthesis protein FlhG